MQVFVPFPDVHKSVQCLDPTRLGNQIYRECITLVKGKWPNHPASKMWWNHSHFLCTYMLAGFKELAARNLYYPHLLEWVKNKRNSVRDTGPPIWWGDMRVHQSHQCSLLVKDFDWYSQYFCPSEYVPYYWPSYTRNEILVHGKQYYESIQKHSPTNKQESSK